MSTVGSVKEERDRVRAILKTIPDKALAEKYITEGTSLADASTDYLTILAKEKEAAQGQEKKNQGEAASTLSFPRGEEMNTKISESIKIARLATSEAKQTLENEYPVMVTEEQ